MKAAQIAKTAHKNGTTLKQEAVALGKTGHGKSNFLDLVKK